MASSYLLSLYSIRDKLTAEVAEMIDDKTVAGAKPNTTGSEMVQHREHWDSRWKALQDVLDKIEMQETKEGINAFELVTEADT